MRFQQQRCPDCGSPMEAFVPVKNAQRYVTWDTRVFQVQAFRCLACMSRSIIQRDTAEAEKDIRAVRGTYIESDGRKFGVNEITETGGGD